MASNSTIVFSLLLFLVIFTYSKAERGHLKETKMTLYFQDYSGVGPDATVIEIMRQPNVLPNFTKFGAIFCMDDPITEEFEETSAQVARGQGIFVTSSLDGLNSHALMSIVFTNEDYKGSTLEIQGGFNQFGQAMELAVVGGTGKFRFARGYVIFEIVHYDEALSYRIMRCNVRVLHY